MIIITMIIIIMMMMMIMIKIMMIIISKTIVIIIWNLQMVRHSGLFGYAMFCGHMYFAVAGPNELSSCHITSITGFMIVNMMTWSNISTKIFDITINNDIFIISFILFYDQRP